MKQRHSSVFVAALLSAAFFSLLLSFGEARAVDMPTPVSGIYTNDQAGVKMTFPDGWSGLAITSDTGLMVSAAPGGMSGGTPTKIMLLTIMDKSKVQTAPTDPSSITKDPSSTCGTPSTSSTKVSGVAASEITVECTNAGVASKVKMVVIQTDARWISAMYMAPSAEFDSDLSAFNTAVSTLQVNGATDIGGGGVNIGLQLKVQSVMLGGKSLQVDVKSSSTISNFNLDEGSKTLTFKAEGQTGTQGKTEIAIGKMLNGPYTVKIDGTATTDFQVAGAGADAMMTVSYTHSAHDVAVTGASVVPEFPIAVVGVIAALIGIVAVIGRTRLLGTESNRTLSDRDLIPSYPFFSRGKAR